MTFDQTEMSCNILVRIHHSKYKKNGIYKMAAITFEKPIPITFWFWMAFSFPSSEFKPPLYLDAIQNLNNLKVKWQQKVNNLKMKWPILGWYSIQIWTTVGAQIPSTSRFWMFEWCSNEEWFWFEHNSKSKLPFIRKQTKWLPSWSPIGYNEDLKFYHLKSRNIWNLLFRINRLVNMYNIDFIFESIIWSILCHFPVLFTFWKSIWQRKTNKKH